MAVMPPPHLYRLSSVHFLRASNLELLDRSSDLMAHNTTLLRGDQRPPDAGDEALSLELPSETDLSWVERGWISAFEETATEPRDDPAGGELAVGLTGDLYYIAPGSSEKLDDTPGKQLLAFLTLPVPDEQDSVADTPTSHG